MFTMRDLRLASPLFPLLFPLFLSSSVCVHGLEQDSLALVALYDSTDGINWTNHSGWLNPDTVLANWYGVTVTNGRVTSLKLPSNNLSGTVPAAIGDLDSLWYLNLALNHHLTGSIPPEIGNLTSLIYLDLAFNRLNGSIPHQIGNLDSLDMLYLNNNQLSGVIPAEICSLANLRVLDLHGNQLSGVIPAEISGLSRLITLDLSWNQINGTIPAEVGSLVTLYRLYLDGNQLTGTVPTEIGNLTNLWYLYLRQNQLTGAIPSEINNLVNLARLYLSDNQLTDLPDLSSLPGLYYLWVSNNHFTFEDLEPNVGVYNFRYYSQDSVGLAQDTTIFLGDTLTISIFVGGTANLYQWRQHGETITDPDTGSSYTISAATYADSGSYTCDITNTIATELTLYSRPIKVTVKEPLSVERLTRKPEEYALHANYPNPFNPATAIRYNLSLATEVSLVVYDILGREVIRLTDGPKEPGYHQLTWDGKTAAGREVPSGIYIARLVTLQYSKSIKMVLLK